MTDAQREHKRKYDRETQAAKRAANPNYKRGVHLRTRYDLTFFCLYGMLACQDFHCATCDKTEASSTRTWHVDHCHTTGKVRGLLCSGCNLGLGHVYDNTETLANMIEYVNRHAALHAGK